MLLECFASCTGCLPRWGRRAADNKGKERAASVPVPVPAEVAPGSAQALAADDANGPKLPFQMKLGVFDLLGECINTQVTINHSVPVNVVTRKLLKELGFKTPRHDLPPELSKFAAEALPAHCGWEQLNICAPGGEKGASHEIQFVVVEDDYYGCDLLLGRASKGINFKLGDGIYTNFRTPPLSKGTLAHARRPM